GRHRAPAHHLAGGELHLPQARASHQAGALVEVAVGLEQALGEGEAVVGVLRQHDHLEALGGPLPAGADGEREPRQRERGPERATAPRVASSAGATGYSTACRPAAATVTSSAAASLTTQPSPLAACARNRWRARWWNARPAASRRSWSERAAARARPRAGSR